MPKMRMNQAIAAALAAAMEADENVIVLGEDVGAAGGPFKTSDKLMDTFGGERVRDTPISEMGFTGAAVGAAMHGLRPVVEIMFMEFLGVALDQLVTQAAKFRYLSQGQYEVPIVVRASVGAGTGFGCQHSQIMQNWVTATPGLAVVCVSDAQSAYSLMTAAIKYPDPIIVLEPRVLYGSRSEVDPDVTLEIGQARTLAEGSDVTLVGWGRTVGVCLEAATQLSEKGVSAEVIDMLSLVPMDKKTILESLGRTGRLLVVEDSPRAGGWGAEVVSMCVDEAWNSFTAEPARVSAPDIPVPYGKELEDTYAPSADEVVRFASELVASGRAPDPWWVRDGFETKGAVS